MTRRSWIAIALAYVVGLWLTNWIGYHLNDWNHEYLWLLLLILFGLVISTVRFLRHKLRNAIAIVLVTVIAVVYLQLRTPQPLYNDVGYQVSQGDRQLVTLTGKVLTEPRLSDRQTLKFVLQTRFKVNENNQEKVSGKLYSSLPLLQGTGIYPGQELSLTGYLYLPQSIKNDYGFDFQQYLARQGIFAGMQGVEASFEPRIQNWSWSRLRQRIVRVHLQGLGSPKGQLVSSMVLGRKAVDLPPDIRDRFIVSGLAHVLAASGFHVSLLLGIVLQLTARIGAKSRLGIGLATLSIYLGLTGIQASVLRACLMGGATLLALTMETKVKPLGSLLLAAVLILLFDPLLIDDLGFKLSFLATFGLIVTLPPLQSKLDWLPPTIATLSAIPLAATIWVLPLLCYEFNTVATYSLAANMICTPLIILVSLGGMISAIAGLILPAFGSAIASLLFYPVSLLMAITQFCSTLPGNNWSVGQIPVGILLTIYGLLILIWQRRWWQKRWWLGLVLPMILIISITLYNSTLVQVSVLATRNLPIVVIRDRGQVVLINSGSDRQAKYTVLPFLAQQGINQIDYGIAINSGFQASTAWKMINSRARISSIYKTMVDGSLSNLPTASHPLTNQITTKSAKLNINAELAVANLKIGDDTWLILGQPNRAAGDRIIKYIQEQNLTAQHPILVWSKDIDPVWLEQLQPRMAIYTSSELNPQTKQILRQKQITYYNTALEGEISWTHQQGFS